MAKQEIESSSNPADFDAVLDVETLARKQGVGPFNFAAARQLGKFWPEDESVDDFVTTVRRWRDEEGEKERP
jgi:hypothetical protein